MANPLNYVLVIILVILWIAAGILGADITVQLRNVRDNDPNLRRAYWYAFWAAFITLGLVALVVLLVILGFIFGFELFGVEAAVVGQQVKGNSVSPLWIFFLVFSIFMVALCGVLLALTSSSIAASPLGSTQPRARRDAVIGASICLGTLSLLAVSVIIYIVVKVRQNRKKKELEEKIADEVAQSQKPAIPTVSQLISQKIARELATVSTQ